MQNIACKLSRITAVAVITAFMALSATAQTSGVLLTIQGSAGSTQVNISASDAAIHSGTFGTGCDSISSDSYVFQGGAPTGCDNGDPFETAQAPGNADVGGFHIKTFYSGTGGQCNTHQTICVTGGFTGAVPDTGFFTVTNNTGQSFKGTITLTGNSAISEGGFCPDSGSASDTYIFTSDTPLLSGNSVTLALSNDSSNCGGWSNSSGTTTITQTAPPVQVTQGTATDANFSFNSTTGQIVDHHVIFPNTVQFPNGNTVNVISTNTILSSSRDWPPFVIGTPFAPSQLFVKKGDNQAEDNAPPDDFGSMYDDSCYAIGADPSTATEQQCPTAVDNNTANLIFAKDIFDPATKPPITPGTGCATDSCTAALIHFFPTMSETWSPSSISPNPVCTVVTGSPPASCDLADLINPTLSGDCCSTISGGGSKKGAYVAVFNVPMLETAIKVNGTSVNTPGRQSAGAVNVPFQQSGSIQFTVYPAGCLNQPVNVACPSIAASGNNQFSAAPAASLTFKVTSGANTVTSGTNSFPTTTVQPQVVTNNTALNPGTYVISFSSLDNVGIVEQNMAQQAPVNGNCPDGSPNATICYVTSGFTTTVNVVGQITSTSQKIQITGTSFQITGGFTVPTATPGINPISQGLTLTLGNYTVTIRPGQFTMNKSSYVFQGNVLNPANSQLVNLQITISPTSGTSFTWKVQAGGGANPVNSTPLILTIGPYSGKLN